MLETCLEMPVYFSTDWLLWTFPVLTYSNKVRIYFYFYKGLGDKFIFLGLFPPNC